MKTASGPTTAISKGDQSVQHNAQEDSREHRITSLSAMKLITEGSWSPTQQRLLEVLQSQEYRFASIAQICQTAGYSANMAWYTAIKNPLLPMVVQPFC